MKRPGLLGRIRKATQKMLQLRRPKDTGPEPHEPQTPDERQRQREYDAAARSNRRARRAMLGRPAGKGIVGYQTNAKAPRYPPLRFQGKDHSQRPATSTKRLGRPRGPGAGGRGGELRRLKEMEERG